MKKLLVAVFDNNEDAFNSSVLINQLHRDGDITVFGTVVLEKDDQGEVSLKQAKDQKSGESWALGFLGGSLIGAFAGPAGLALGASIGGLTGLCVDVDRAGVDVTFIDEVSAAIEPGKTALVIDLDEGWTTPIDSCVDSNNGIVFRRNRSEVVEDQLQREAEEISREYAELKSDMASANDEAKASMQKHLDALNKKSKETQRLINKRVADIQDDASLKSKALTAQIDTATEKGKVKIEKRLASLQESLEQNQAQLQSSYDKLD
jgi:uncharacterized membrane protein